MSDFASRIVSSRLAEVSARLTARMQEISDQTGVQFSNLFADKLRQAAVNSVMSGVSGNEDYAGYTAEDDEPGAVYEPQAVSPATAGARGNYDGIISAAAEKYGIDDSLLRAVVWAESNFNANAVSASGASGLMQLMPDVAMLLGVDDVFDPEQNVDAGAGLLAARIEEYGGDMRMALASYNMGAAGLAARGVTGLSGAEEMSLLPAETRAYISRIEGYLDAAGIGGAA